MLNFRSKILQHLSKLTDFKIPIGESMTTTDPVVAERQKSLNGRVIRKRTCSYKLKDKYCCYELSGIVKDPETNEVCYELVSVIDDRVMRLNKEAFDEIFEK